MNDRNLRDTVVRQAVELTQVTAELYTLKEVYEALRNLVDNGKEELARLQSQEKELGRIRELLQASIRALPIPYPLRNQPGVPKTALGELEFDSSRTAVTCRATYEQQGSVYSLDFMFIPVPKVGNKAKEYYPGHKFDVWTPPVKKKKKPRVKST